MSIRKPKQTLKRRRKLRKDRVALALFIVFFIPGLLIYRSVSAYVQGKMNPKDSGTLRVDRYRDLNEAQLVHARRIGISPFNTNAEFHDQKDELVDDGRLVKIKDGNRYVIEKLQHSQPYLVPEAAELLDDIGRRFRKKLDEHDKGYWYFRVSSLLRTAESQRALSRMNGNATKNSAHLYGTTFDISYSRVIKKPLPWIRRNVTDASVIKLLSETIGEMRKEGRCLVVTEYKEKCFHITVAR